MRQLVEKIFFISLLILLLILGAKSFFLEFNQPQVDWGVSFDPYYTAALGFTPQEVYNEILTDLKVDHLRLTAYWNRIEGSRDVYDWSDLDWQVEQADKTGVKILMTLGRKLPRWPECYEPVWLNHLSKAEREKELLEIIQLTIERYQNYNNIIAWQVENEPLVGWFGVCPPPDKEELKKEIALVKKIDERPIIITDSGELSAWLTTARLTEVLGTTMYRIVENEYIGFWHWPLPPAYYYYKTQLVKKLTGVEKVIVTELQAEAWSVGPIQDFPLAKQYKSMDPQQFRDNIEYVQQAGFDTVYLWGVEWWYWMKEKQGVDDYWLEARKLWNKNNIQNFQSNDLVNEWQIYKNEELKFEFKYPKSFGDLNLKILSEQIRGEFSNNKDIIVGGITKNYTYPRSGHYKDFSGFKIENNKYFEGSSGDQYFPITPKEIINSNIIVVDCMSYEEKCNINAPTISVPSDMIAGLINLQDDKYTGLIFATYKENIGEELLIEILSTFKFID